MSHCEGCKKYTDCKDGSGLTWPCGAYRPVVTTNADRIRGMSDEGLAEFLISFSTKKAIKAANKVFVTRTGIVDWLKQPVKEATP